MALGVRQLETIQLLQLKGSFLGLSDTIGQHTFFIFIYDDNPDTGRNYLGLGQCKPGCLVDSDMFTGPPYPLVSDVMCWSNEASI